MSGCVRTPDTLPATWRVLSNVSSQPSSPLKNPEGLPGGGDARADGECNQAKKSIKGKAPGSSCCREGRWEMVGDEATQKGEEGLQLSC